MADATMDRPVLRVLSGEAISPPPAWMMRQAGRYLQEYRATRAEAGSFLDLCYSPDFVSAPPGGVGGLGRSPGGSPRRL